MTIRGANPKAVSHDEYYTARYSHDEEKLIISFLNEKYTVISLKAHYGEFMAMILHLVASDGHSHFFYSATSDPFNSDYREIYNIEN